MGERKRNKSLESLIGHAPKANRNKALQFLHHPSNCHCHVRNGAVNENKCPLCDTAIKPLKTNKDWQKIILKIKEL